MAIKVVPLGMLRPGQQAHAAADGNTSLGNRIGAEGELGDEGYGSGQAGNATVSELSASHKWERRAELAEAVRRESDSGANCRNAVANNTESVASPRGPSTHTAPHAASSGFSMNA